MEVHIQVKVGQGREALEDPEDSVDPVSNQKKSKSSKAISTLKKVAVVGAVGYGAYKIGQLSSRFSGLRVGSPGYPGYGFNDWNRWRQADGFLCRNDNDCRWLDRNLECDRVGNFGWSISVSCVTYFLYWCYFFQLNYKGFYNI